MALLLSDGSRSRRVTIQLAIVPHQIHLEWLDNRKVKDEYVLIAAYSNQKHNQNYKSICGYSPSLTISPWFLVTIQNQGNCYGYL